MLGRDVFSKHKPNIKLATRFDGDGNEIQVEEREDLEQSEKLQEIIDILVAAGYFRARIKGITPFDKVVGGMTWCIESCNYDIDVDLLFQENLTIGQKISLTEKIVAVLPKMNCPHAIEPHQIQGLDFIHIFPVVQWLVKRSVESREEKAGRVREFAIDQFDKTFYFQSERDKLEAQRKLHTNLRNVTESYGPKRQYRRKGKAPDEESVRVQITLLEYGSRSVKSPETSSVQKEQSAPESELEIDEARQGDEIDVEQFVGSMAIENEPENTVILDANEKAQIAEHYASLHAEMTADNTQVAAEKQHGSLIAQRQSLQVQLKKLQNNKESLEKQLEENTTNLQEVKLKRHLIERELEEMTVTVDKDKQGALSKLQDLIELNEKLKTQEIVFKKQCISELADIKQRITELADLTPDGETAECKASLETYKQKVQTLKLELASKTRAIATLQRQLDEIPGRAELAQYQRRFLELYNQVAAKHRETKQFFTLYNTLDDTKMYLSKELSLLNSILDNYQEAMSSQSQRDEFVKQFEAIVDGIKQSKSKVEARYTEERAKRDSLSQQLLLLVDQQRRYVLAVQQLDKECQKNEALLTQLKAIKTPSLNAD